MLKTFFFLIVVIFSLIILQFAVNTKYSFPEPQPFKGDYLYNPYKDMDLSKWKMANFHAHTRLYGGLTNGAANTDQALDSYYRQFGYDIINISNYQNINTFESGNRWYIPVYEHGYQYYKNHQIVLNAKRIRWLDYPFRQTLHNKQLVIDRLKRDTSVIVSIVHPVKRGAYSFSDLKYLANYDCLEIASHEAVYTSYYDTILSTGHPVFLLADDDTHNMTGKNDACQSFNLIKADLDKSAILHAIKTGCLVGVKLNRDSCLSDRKKISVLENLPEITGINLNGDQLTVSLNKPVKSIRFIGQNGAEKKKIINTSGGSYLFGKQDTYIRTEIECLNGAIYFLNPVFRYNGINPDMPLPAPDIPKTWISRIIILFFILFIPAMGIRKQVYSWFKRQAGFRGAPEALIPES
ncbi:MAG: hypothetical protein WCE64_00065 [Bacteroidales bacterium]